MISQTTLCPETDPTIAVAERQLVLLGEMVELAMAASRAASAASVAASRAEQKILAEEWYTPEVGRARACGAKDAADSLQKITRAVRLTMKMQLAVAGTVRDLRAGVFRPVEDAGGTPADLDGALVRRRLAGSCSTDRDSDWTRGATDTDHLVEFDRSEGLTVAPFRDAVDTLCADVGATVDWTCWKLEAPTAKTESSAPTQPHRQPETVDPP